ncbi:pyridoxal phosphate-dependent decarboxylase family protein [Anabaena subtropica]|uniref:Aspartate aminotransferase family protein n=1 Tax=Anabaena subtropica FACHB-260 TaxID=2692884 RepID=A0ABR8CSS8_9NOST|nr:pyridoxal-dependent decarboxylase [Anabaena subtropica]MBD2346262.1 aspartate aminotransferase family protein [Anabaena subtropica FACHB-260]
MIKAIHQEKHGFYLINQNQKLNNSLLKYSKYCLNNTNLDDDFLDVVTQLLTGLKKILIDANLTDSINSEFKVELEINKIPTKGWSIEDVIQNIILNYLGNVPNYSAGYAPLNVIPPPLIPAILAKFACAIINPNLVYESYAGKAIEAEQLAISHLAEIIGFEPKISGGYFTSGGSASNYWAVRCALEKAFPGLGEKGFKAFSNQEPVVIQSVLGHYTNVNAARLLGIGTENVISVSVTPDFSISLPAFQSQMEKAIKENKQVVCIYLIAGQTDSFGVDDVKGVVRICEELCRKYHVPKPHIHVDAAVGWVYSIFKNYQITDNSLGFSTDTLDVIRKLNNLYSSLSYADSITVDPHKHGFTAYTSSALIFKNKRDLLLLQKDFHETPYFTEDIFCSFPGAYTPESSRPGDGPLMILANLYALGYEGYQTMIGYAIQQSIIFQSKLQFSFKNSVQVLNQNVPGTSTLWRFYPPGMEAQEAYNRELLGTSEEDCNFTQKINEYNHNLFAKSKNMRSHNTPILGYSHQVIVNKSGMPISAWKCIIINPFVNILSIIDNLHILLDMVVEN